MTQNSDPAERRFSTTQRVVGVSGGRTTTDSNNTANRTTAGSSSDGTAESTHDLVDQLTGADNQTSSDEWFSYDTTGNRTGTGHTVAAGNWLLSDGSYSSEFDDEGNSPRQTRAQNTPARLLSRRAKIVLTDNDRPENKRRAIVLAWMRCTITRPTRRG